MPLLMTLISLGLSAVRPDSTLSTNVKNRTEQKQTYIDFELQTNCDNMIQYYTYAQKKRYMQNFR